jgi:tetratricopeptide (TPR) repeat protein
LVNWVQPVSDFPDLAAQSRAMPMNEFDKTIAEPEGSLNSPVVSQLREEFEHACKRAADGGSLPDLDSFVDQAPETERAALRLALEAIWRAQQQPGAPPQTDASLAGTEYIEPGAPADLAPDALSDSLFLDSDQRSDLPPQMDASLAGTEYIEPGADADPALDALSDVQFLDSDQQSDVGMTVEQAPSIDLGVTVEQAPSVHLGETVDPSTQLKGPANPTYTPGSPGKRPAPSRTEGSRDWPVVEGYEILGELGRGAMGVVYKARQRGLKRLVALKMVLAGAHASEAQLARFHTEAEAVARLQHPNIVQIYDVGERDGLPFFSLEYLDGGVLAQKLAGKPVPAREAARITQQLADAMALAHQQNIIHRDLKPANVLLTRDGVPKITDFGLAKRLEDDSSHTKSGTLMGTPSYMAPEQARGDAREIGPVSDQYALGAILYELLTGRPPFVGASILDTLQQVRLREPIPPSRLVPKVPNDLETICLKCLQKEIPKRYPSTDALAEDLKRFLAGEPIKARPVTRLERAWRWCRRNPRIAVLSAALGVMVIILGVVLTQKAVREAQEKQAVAQRHAQEQKSIEEAGRRAEQKIELATEAVSAGHHVRALDLLKDAPPLLESDGLADLRSSWRTLQAQTELYAEFKSLLDRARLDSLYGTESTRPRAQEVFRQLIGLYEELRERTGKGASGLPPLDSQQQQLFQEDVFEVFLLAALVETQAAVRSDQPAQQDAARRAIAWLDRVEKLLPPTRAFYSHRSHYHKTVGNKAAFEADDTRARGIKATSAIDHFWHGFAEERRAQEADAKGDPRRARDLYHSALAEYTALLRIHPQHFWAYFNWANCQFQLRNYHDALLGYTACIHINPTVSRPYHNRGTTHRLLKQYREAVADYTAALERDDRAVETCLFRALVYLEAGLNDRAQEDFDRALKIDPKNAGAYFQRAEAQRKRKQFPEAQRDYDQAVQLNPQFAEAYTGRGLNHLALDQVGPAIEDFGKAIKANPNQAAAYFQRAEAYRGQGRLADAIKDYSKVIELRPQDAQALFLRAEVYRDLKQEWNALRDYDRVLALNPEHSAAYLGRTMVQQQSSGKPQFLRTRAMANLVLYRNLDASLADWHELSALQPSAPEPHFGIAIIRLGRRQYDLALLALAKARELNPSYVDVSWARAQVHHWQGKLDEALADINPVVEKLPPTKPEGLNLRGDLFRTLGRLDDAAADYKRLIGLKPTNLDAYISLAGVYAKQDQMEEAKKCLDALVAANATVARAYLDRAEFRRIWGEYEAARADCEAAARVEPKLGLVDLVRARIDACCGRHHAAVAEAERVLATAPARDGRTLYAAATVFSLAAGAAAKDQDQATALRSRQYAERAVSLVVETLDKGFHDLIYPEHNRMADDPALAAIRDDPRVSDLLAHRP